MSLLWLALLPIVTQFERDFANVCEPRIDSIETKLVSNIVLSLSKNACRRWNSTN